MMSNCIGTPQSISVPCAVVVRTAGAVDEEVQLASSPHPTMSKIHTRSMLMDWYKDRDTDWD